MQTKSDGSANGHQVPGGEAIVRGIVAHRRDTDVRACPAPKIYGLFDAFKQEAVKYRRPSRAGMRLHGVMAIARYTGGPAVQRGCPGPGYVLNAGGRPCRRHYGSKRAGAVPDRDRCRQQYLGKAAGHLHEMPDSLAPLRIFVNWADRIGTSRRGATLGQPRIPGDAVGTARAGGALRMHLGTYSRSAADV